MTPRAHKPEEPQEAPPSTDGEAAVTAPQVDSPIIETPTIPDDEVGPASGDTVVCIGTHGIDLADGRQLMPGEKATGVDVELPHNAALITDGHLTVMKEDN